MIYFKNSTENQELNIQDILYFSLFIFFIFQCYFLTGHKSYAFSIYIKINI